MVSSWELSGAGTELGDGVTPCVGSTPVGVAPVVGLLPFGMPGTWAVVFGALLLGWLEFTPFELDPEQAAVKPAAVNKLTARISLPFTIAMPPENLSSLKIAGGVALPKSNRVRSF
jgi:hypothetical protein